jgi:hypothetical protein
MGVGCTRKWAAYQRPFHAEPTLSVLQARLCYNIAMIVEPERWYEYDEESDVLDVHFVAQRRPDWTIELTPNMMISIDRASRQVISLTFLDYTALIEPTLWGKRSFPVTGLANLPPDEQELVLTILNQPPVQKWVGISVVQNLPDSPFTVAHLEAPPAAFLPSLALEIA